ncbi:hypothetical protein HNR77_004770 [Paenibacillus sp. JGP012]|nr:hypothetical protein [Paenibacillus sp. JGP012]
MFLLKKESLPRAAALFAFFGEIGYLQNGNSHPCTPPATIEYVFGKVRIIRLKIRIYAPYKVN